MCKQHLLRISFLVMAFFFLTMATISSATGFNETEEPAAMKDSSGKIGCTTEAGVFLEALDVRGIFDFEPEDNAGVSEQVDVSADAAANATTPSAIAPQEEFVVFDDTPILVTDVLTRKMAADMVKIPQGSPELPDTGGVPILMFIGAGVLFTLMGLKVRKGI
jgi:hypothetical protein